MTQMTQMVMLRSNGMFWVAAVILLVQANPRAADRVIGLLRLPEVFGSAPCAPFEPRVVTLHAEPGGAQVASIQVDQNWSFAPHGGCEGLQVSVHRGNAREELPTREYDYEAPAAIVVEQRGLWFRVCLSGDASAWVEVPFADRFLPLESLYEEFIGVTFIAEGGRGQLSKAPVGTVSDRGGPSVTPGQPVRVIETRRLAERLWLHVEVFSHSICNAAASGPPDVVAQGWMPAHLPSGEPAVWFASRGC
jgi:hypothetical protein